MEIRINENENISNNFAKKQRGILSNRLRQALAELDIPFFYDLSNIDEGVKIILQLKEKEYLFIKVNKDKLYSETAFVFLLWMIFASILLLFFSYFFMNKQIRPLKRLAIIAETFGRGLDAPELKSTGASEIRQTANAFNQMRTRIKRFLKQRTDMLAGVSHDLRTPLTRLKLALALKEEDAEVREMLDDIQLMQNILDEFLEFSKNQRTEKIKEISFLHHKI